MKPSLCAAALDRSRTRPLANGPRSLMRTITLLPFFWLVTLTFVPKGSVRCAAVMAAGFMRSPDAVFEVRAYQEALPHCAEAGCATVSTRPAAMVAAPAAFPSFVICILLLEHG